MPRASRIVDDAGVVHNVIQFKIAVNQQVRTVSKAYIAVDGVIRQFWPPIGVVVYGPGENP